ncbi:MAG: TldD/PmbA family protein [Candidatus Bathyarchaeota archaeon]|nr:TldD/PmbA family protein [Candidatus Bathyarchaeota archaeon]
MSEVIAETENIVKMGKNLGADEVIAKTIFGRYRQTRFSNNQVDISAAWNDYVTDVMLTWKRRLVATEIRNFQNVEESVKRLFSLAKASKENPTYGGVARGKFSYQKSRADKAVGNLENPAEYVFEAIEAARNEAGPNINAGGILFSSLENVYLVSSEGPIGEDTRSAIELSIRAFSEREASGHGVECSSTLNNFDPARAGRKAGEIAKQARNPKPGIEGQYDVIFDPLFVGSLLGMWGRMTSAFSVMIQLSVFVNKLGQKVASETVTLRDNPAAYSMGNRVFDDEGVPARENVLIGKGVLKTYLHNTSTAKKFQTETTGNAGIVVPTPWNLELDAGSMNREEMFREVKHGLYLTNTWYTRFQNWAKGDFSTIPRDGIFLVEGGEIKQSWKDVRISDNALRMLNNIAGISKERQPVHWWIEARPPSLSPYILMKDVQITRPK